MAKKHRILITPTGKRFYISNTDKDYHTQFGFITAQQLEKTGEVKSNTGKEFFVLEPSFIDAYNKIKRQAQIIPLKDIGSIIAYTGINKESKVVDAGAGSGALACFLAHLCKQVTTYDIREDHISIAEKNKEFLELKNLKVKKGDIYEKIEETKLDLITLDVPEPWKALESCKKSLKSGGFIVSYSPTIPQVQDFVNTVLKDKDLLFVKAIEIIEREWEIFERRVRPKTQQIGHSGFLTFIRKLK